MAELSKAYLDSMRALQERLKQMTMTISKHQSTIQRLEAELRSRQSRLTKVTSQYELQVSSLQERVRSLESELSLLRSQLSKSSVGDGNLEMESLRSANGRLKSELEALRNQQLSDSKLRLEGEDQLRLLKRQIEDFKREKEEWERMKAGEASWRDKYQRLKTDSDDQLRVLKRQKEEAVRFRSESEQTIRVLKRQIQDLKREKEDLERMKAGESGWRQKYDKMELRLRSEYQEQIRVLKRQIQDLKRGMEQMGVWREKYERLAKEVQQKESWLKQLMSQNSGFIRKMSVKMTERPQLQRKKIMRSTWVPNLSTSQIEQ